MNDFLVWLGTGVGAMVAFSFLVELFPGWHFLPSEKKRLFSKLGSVIVALLAFVVLNFVPVEVIALVDPYFKVIVGVLVLDAGAQGFHAITKSP